MSLRTRRTGLLPLAPPLALMPLVLLALASPQETGPKQGGGRPIVLGSSCVTSECHTGYNAGKFVHGPVALNLCDACHVMLEEGEHKFKMMKDVPDLCMFCHDTMPVRQHDHEPVAAGMCQACHDPHRSEFPFLLTADPSGPLCFSCHDQLDFDSHEYVHAPVVAGGFYGFVHWVLYNIPAATTSLGSGATEYSSGPTGFGREGYGGPMPPPGHGTHYYFFMIFALDSEPDLEPGLSFSALLERIEPHTLGMNRLVGTYERS